MTTLLDMSRQFAAVSRGDDSNPHYNKWVARGEYHTHAKLIAMGYKSTGRDGRDNESYQKMIEHPRFGFNGHYITRHGKSNRITESVHDGNYAAAAAESFVSFDHDAAVGEACDKDDFDTVVKRLRAIHQEGPRIPGMQPYGNAGQHAILYNPEKSKATLRAIHQALIQHGYVVSGTGKMFGGSETLKNYKHPDMPHHKYQVRVRPYTLQGVRHAEIHLSVEQSWPKV